MTAGWAVLLMLLGLWPGSANPSGRTTTGISVAPVNVSAEQFEQDQHQCLTLERSV